MSGLLQAVALYLLYFAISMTDIWGYFPPITHALVYGGVFLTIMILLSWALLAKTPHSPKASLKAFVLSLSLLLISGVMAGADAKRLLEIAVKPRAIFEYPVPEITMTVTPPSYSGEESFTESLLLDNANLAGHKPIPEGSIVTISLKNVTYAPILSTGRQTVPFLSGEAGTFAAQFTLKDEIIWKVSEGTRMVGEWPIVILEDEAPIIDRADFRQLMTGDGLFGLSLEMSDDYGIQEVSVGILDVTDEPTPLKITGVKDYSGDVYLNFAASDFAGKQVDIVVSVTDQAGQEQQKVISNVTLPAQDFENPMSRKLAKIRDGVKSQPENKKKLVRELMALSLVPDDGQTPSIYYMGLRSAYWRLTTPTEEGDVESARHILWELAQKLEAGRQGQFNQDMLGYLAGLKLSLYQQHDMKKVKKQLQEMDAFMVQFLRSQSRSLPEQVNLQQYNIPALRKIYSKILSHIYYEKFDQALDLLSYLEHGFIYRDRDMLSAQGYARFLVINETREKINLIEETQRQVMSYVYKKSVKLEYASAKGTDHLKLADSKDFQSWVKVQQKLAVSITDLDRTLLKFGINASSITGAVDSLTGDVVNSMETGNMEAAAQYQSQIMTLLKSMKGLLDRNVSFPLNAEK